MSNIYTDFSFWIERIENRESNEKIIWGHHIGREFNHESINFEGDLYQNEEKIRLDLSDIHIHIHNRMYDRGNPIFCVDKENKLKEQSLLAVNSSVANIFNGAVSFEFKVENKKSALIERFFYFL